MVCTTWDVALSLYKPTIAKDAYLLLDPRNRVQLFIPERRMSSSQDLSYSKKKETRAGTRRVTSLSTEQLERKRANDREAQRTIRQRTKEHIERLELQVAELRAKGDKFDEIVRRNTLLENEIRTLRHQVSMASESPSYQNLGKLHSLVIHFANLALQHPANFHRSLRRGAIQPTAWTDYSITSISRWLRSELSI